MTDVSQSTHYLIFVRTTKSGTVRNLYVILKIVLVDLITILYNHQLSMIQVAA